MTRAYKIDHLPCFVRVQHVPVNNHRRQLGGNLSFLHREHQRQRGESVRDVLTGRLSDLVLAAFVVENIVCDLEGEAKETAVRAQRGTPGITKTSHESPDVAAGGEQCGG